MRFRFLADLPPEDLDFLSGKIRLALDVSQEASITALLAAVRAEIRNRDAVPGDCTPDTLDRRRDLVSGGLHGRKELREMNEQPNPSAPDAGKVPENTQGSESKSRPVYDTTVSESTRELRDTSRRRREAEEKLQQHLLEAKEHVPHQHDQEQRQDDIDPDAGTADAGKAAQGAGTKKDLEANKDSEGDG